jgi:hypothetical protein
MHKMLECGLCFKNMYHSLQLTYRDAASNCCEYGLALASVETPDELKCIHNGTLGDELLSAYHLFNSNNLIE